MIKFTIILYHNLMQKEERVPIKCTFCGRTLFKAHPSQILVTNGASESAYAPEDKYIEIKCGSCNRLYNILFQ